jgi:hypothetical protein
MLREEAEDLLLTPEQLAFKKQWRKIKMATGLKRVCVVYWYCLLWHSIPYRECVLFIGIVYWYSIQ